MGSDGAKLPLPDVLKDLPWPPVGGRGVASAESAAGGGAGSVIGVPTDRGQDKATASTASTTSTSTQGIGHHSALKGVGGTGVGGQRLAASQSTPPKSAPDGGGLGGGGLPPKARVGTMTPPPASGSGGRKMRAPYNSCDGRLTLRGVGGGGVDGGGNSLPLRGVDGGGVDGGGGNSPSLRGVDGGGGNTPTLQKQGSDADSGEPVRFGGQRAEGRGPSSPIASPEAGDGGGVLSRAYLDDHSLGINSLTAEDQVAPSASARAPRHSDQGGAPLMRVDSRWRTIPSSDDRPATFALSFRLTGGERWERSVGRGVSGEAWRMGLHCMISLWTNVLMPLV